MQQRARRRHGAVNSRASCCCSLPVEQKQRQESGGAEDGDTGGRTTGSAGTGCIRRELHGENPDRDLGIHRGWLRRRCRDPGRRWRVSHSAPHSRNEQRERLEQRTGKKRERKKRGMAHGHRPGFIDGKGSRMRANDGKLRAAMELLQPGSLTGRRSDGPGRDGEELLRDGSYAGVRGSLGTESLLGHRERRGSISSATGGWLAMH